MKTLPLGWTSSSSASICLVPRHRLLAYFTLTKSNIFAMVSTFSRTISMWISSGFSNERYVMLLVSLPIGMACWNNKRPVSKGFNVKIVYRMQSNSWWYHAVLIPVGPAPWILGGRMGLWRNKMSVQQYAKETKLTKAEPLKLIIVLVTKEIDFKLSKEWRTSKLFLK